WDNHRAHVRWTHRINESNEPSLSPPVQTKTASVQASSSPSIQRLLDRPITTFQTLLLQQSHDSGFNIDSDEESFSE
ncbi:unnamed protein product, partial [Adineta steineri]